MQEKAAVTLVGLTTGVVLVAVVVISGTDGIRPYGEQELLAQIEQEDTAFCAKSGVAAATPHLDACVRDLAELWQHHLDLLRSHWWL